MKKLSALLLAVLIAISVFATGVFAAGVKYDVTDAGITFELPDTYAGFDRYTEADDERFGEFFTDIDDLNSYLDGMDAVFMAYDMDSAMTVDICIEDEGMYDPASLTDADIIDLRDYYIENNLQAYMSDFDLYAVTVGGVSYIATEYYDNEDDYVCATYVTGDDDHTYYFYFTDFTGGNDIARCTAAAESILETVVYNEASTEGSTGSNIIVIPSNTENSSDSDAPTDEPEDNSTGITVHVGDSTEDDTDEPIYVESDDGVDFVDVFFSGFSDGYSSMSPYYTTLYIYAAILFVIRFIFIRTSIEKKNARIFAVLYTLIVGGLLVVYNFIDSGVYGLILSAVPLIPWAFIAYGLMSSGKRRQREQSAAVRAYPKGTYVINGQTYAAPERFETTDVEEQITPDMPSNFKTDSEAVYAPPAPAPYISKYTNIDDEEDTETEVGFEEENAFDDSGDEFDSEFDSEFESDADSDFEGDFEL